MHGCVPWDALTFPTHCVSLLLLLGSRFGQGEGFIVNHSNLDSNSLAGLSIGQH